MPQNGTLVIADITYYCAHGDTMYPQAIVDWRPADEYSFIGAGLMGSRLLNTVKLVPVGGGKKTRSTAYFGRAQGGFSLGRLIMDTYCRFLITKSAIKSCEALDEKMKQDIAAGLVVDSAGDRFAADISPEQVKEAIGAALIS